MSLDIFWIDSDAHDLDERFLIMQYGIETFNELNKAVEKDRRLLSLANRVNKTIKTF